MIYALGRPLTGFVLNYHSGTEREFFSSDLWWTVPLVDFLFVLQWVIWGQLLALGVRLVKRIVPGTQHSLDGKQRTGALKAIFLTLFVIWFGVAPVLGAILGGCSGVLIGFLGTGITFIVVFGVLMQVCPEILSKLREE